MELLSGGFYKATIHRVVQPPPDQRQLARLGVYYFGMADDNVRLAPLGASPVLHRVEEQSAFKSIEEAPLMEEWRKSRTIAYGKSQLKKREDGTEIEIIEGLEVKHYN